MRLLLRFQLLFVRLRAVLFPESVHYIGGPDYLPAPLPKAEEREALAELLAGSREARDRLIEHNLRLVVYIARRFENTGVKNIRLATYASRCIENEILMYLRKVTPLRSEVSLSEPLNTDWDGNELLLSDILGTDNDMVMRPIEDDVDRQLLREALSKLTDREKTLITLRYGLTGGKELTQKEVADRLGISQSYISRLEKRIIARLHRDMSRKLSDAG